MSGFAAILDSNPDRLARRVEAVRRALAGSAGEWRDPGAGVALLTAPSRAGDIAALPVLHPSGRVIVGDVRLDDRASLAAAAGVGSDSTSHADAAAPPSHALVLAAWDRWGVRALERMTGDFAFALWDPSVRRLWLARDGLGVRTVYLAATAGGAAATNRIAVARSVLASPDALDDGALDAFLRSGFDHCAERTVFRGIRAIPRATHLVVRPDGATSDAGTHWSMPSPRPWRPRSDGEVIEAMRDALGGAVRDRVDGPATLMLSGGLDSGAIAACAAGAVPGLVRALTTDSGALVRDDEPPLAAMIARQCGMPHELYGEVPVPLAHLTDGSAAPALPVDDPALAWTRALAGRAAAHGSIVLVGEDGDAVLSPPPLWHAMRTHGVRPMLSAAWRYAAATGHRPYLGIWLRERVRHWGKRAPADLPATPWLGDSRSGDAGREWDARWPVSTEGAASLLSPLWQALHTDTAAETTGCDLSYRWPFLDERVLALALSLPPVPWRQRKAVLRHAFAGLLPPEVIARQKTPLRGTTEALVALWRRSWDGRIAPLDPRLTDRVVMASFHHTLLRGPAESVLAAWRVFLLDGWLRRTIPS